MITRLERNLYEVSSKYHNIRFEGSKDYLAERLTKHGVWTTEKLFEVLDTLDIGDSTKEPYGFYKD